MGEGAVAPGTTAKALGATTPSPITYATVVAIILKHTDCGWKFLLMQCLCDSLHRHWHLADTRRGNTVCLWDISHSPSQNDARHHSAAQASSVYLSNNPTVRTSASIQLTARSDKNTNSCYKSTRTLTLENCTVSNKWTWFLRINSKCSKCPPANLQLSVGFCTHWWLRHLHSAADCARQQWTRCCFRLSTPHTLLSSGFRHNWKFNVKYRPTLDFQTA